MRMNYLLSLIALFFFISPCSIFSVEVETFELKLVPKTAPNRAQPKENVEYEVLGVGTAITDFMIPVSDEFLMRHTQKGGSSVVSIEKIEELIKESQANPIVKPGGSCPNTLKGLGRLGVRTAYHLRDGVDEYGIRFENNLRDNNVAVLKVNDTLLPSGRLVCLMTPDRNRSFLSFPGAGDAFCPADLEPLWFEKARIVHLDGYSLRNKSLVEESMRIAKEQGAMISFDPGCFQLAREYKELILFLLEEYVDIAFTNEDEMKELFDLPPEEACRAMSQLVGVSVLLRGDKGCLIGVEDALFTAPVRKVPVVDTTGAGDLFACGFLYGLLQGYDLKKCAYIGNYLGSSVIQHVGAEIPLECWDDIVAHLNSGEFLR